MSSTSLNRASAASRAWPASVWLPLVLLPLVLLAMTFVSLGHGIADVDRSVTLQQAREHWAALEPQLLDERADAASRTETLRRLDDALTLSDSRRLADSFAPWVRWVPPALGALSLILCVWLWRALSSMRKTRRRIEDGRMRRDQAAILALLDDMTPLADGDLTVRATVDEAMTGALADAFNQAVTALRQLVADTGHSAKEVGKAVAATRTSTRSLSSAASVQSREILRASNYLNVMSGAIAELSMNATASARKALQTRAAAGDGRGALIEAGVQLDRIRDEAALTMRLTHRLADNVRAIDAEVETVRAIATRSELLSLNTTVRAAAASQRVADADVAADERSTSDYARLADDVSDLATVLGSASREISSLTAVIRDDADETLRAMSTTDAALRAGVDEAAALFGHLKTIDTSVAALDGLIGDTADRAARQADVVRRLSGNMTVLNRLGRDGATGLADASASLDDLQALAEALDARVAGFRLPAGSPVPWSSGIEAPSFDDFEADDYPLDDDATVDTAALTDRSAPRAGIAPPAGSGGTVNPSASEALARSAAPAASET